VLSSPAKDEADWTLDEWRTHALRLRRKVLELQAGLPHRVRLVKPRDRIKAALDPSKRWDRAHDLLLIQEDLRANGRPHTDEAAVREWHRRNGRHGYHSQKTYINDMGKLRKRLGRTHKKR
jgi:hypothetical protein